MGGEGEGIRLGKIRVCAGVGAERRRVMMNTRGVGFKSQTVLTLYYSIGTVHPTEQPPRSRAQADFFSFRLPRTAPPSTLKTDGISFNFWL